MFVHTGPQGANSKVKDLARDGFALPGKPVDGSSSSSSSASSEGSADVSICPPSQAAKQAAGVNPTPLPACPSLHSDTPGSPLPPPKQESPLVWSQSSYESPLSATQGNPMHFLLLSAN